MIQVTTLILAAGFSSRMNTDKALLKLKNGKTFIQQIIDNLKSIDLQEIFVVCQKKMDADLKNVKFVINDSPEKGMLYSIQTGLNKVEEKSECVMIYPVDMPLVKRETLQILCDHASIDSIVLPKYQGKRGHPVLIGRNFFEDIMNAPLDIGLRYVVYQHKEKIYELITEDNGINININNPEIYNKTIKN